MTPQEMLKELHDAGVDWPYIRISRRTFFRVLDGGNPSQHTKEKIEDAYNEMVADDKWLSDAEYLGYDPMDY